MSKIKSLLMKRLAIPVGRKMTIMEKIITVLFFSIDSYIIFMVFQIVKALKIF